MKIRLAQENDLGLGKEMGLVEKFKMFLRNHPLARSNNELMKHYRLLGYLRRLGTEPLTWNTIPILGGIAHIMGKIHSVTSNVTSGRNISPPHSEAIGQYVKRAVKDMDMIH